MQGLGEFAKISTDCLSNNAIARVAPTNGGTKMLLGTNPNQALIELGNSVSTSSNELDMPRTQRT